MCKPVVFLIFGRAYCAIHELILFMKFCCLGKMLRYFYKFCDIISIMKSIKPELYCDEKGNPKGYRVGISNGVYGTCPFCGKSYTEEDITNGDVNFEHIFSRFAVKKATDEPKVFSKIESEFMVGVHKDCNDRCSMELERQISRIIANVNKPHVHLMQDDIVALFNYCIKTSIFLRYLFMWEDNTKPFCYDTEKISLQKNSELIQGLNFYKDFAIRIRKVDSSAGLYWASRYPLEGSEYCFTSVLDNIEISFFPDSFWYKYENVNRSIVIKTGNNGFYWYYSKEGQSLSIQEIARHCFSITNKKGIPWVLERDFEQKSYWTHTYNHHISTLSGFYDDLFNLPKNYFVRQLKLSKMSQQRFEENKILAIKDRRIVFYRDGQFYFVNDDGIIQNVSEMPMKTVIPAIAFRGDQNIPHLPDISQIKIVKNFIIWDSNLTSLLGAPQFIGGYFDVRYNKLKTLEGSPKYVGENFNCSHNELTSLIGAPKNIKGYFYCAYNKLTTLVGAPETVASSFVCRNNNLISLEGAPRKVVGFFDCSENKLISLKGAPEVIVGTFTFDAGNLVSLDGLPRAKNYLVADCGMFFYTPQELRKWFTEYKNGQMIKKLQDGAKKLVALAAIARKNKNIPDDQHEI